MPISKILERISDKPTHEFAAKMVKILDGQIHFISQSRKKSDPDGEIWKFENQFRFQRDAWQMITDRCCSRCKGKGRICYCVDGFGHNPNDEMMKCPDCNGTGEQPSVSHSPEKDKS